MEKPYYILIVDDEPDICEFISYYLKKRGFETEISYNGNEALEAIHKKLPDLILTDILMPEMNGISLCRKLKESSLTELIPVVFLSATNDELHLLSAMNAGAEDYISKPVRLSRIEEKIHSIIKKVA